MEHNSAPSRCVMATSTIAVIYLEFSIALLAGYMSSEFPSRFIVILRIFGKTIIKGVVYLSGTLSIVS